MRNLRQPIARILLNSVTAHDIGVFGDDVQKRRILTFKKAGVKLPGDAHTPNTTTALTASGTLNADLHVAKSVSDDGLKKGWLVEFNPAAPADNTYWGYGLTISPKVKLPGVRNNRHKAHQITYEGEIASIVSTSGYVDDNYVLSAEDDLITQIYLDTGAHVNNTDPISRLTGAVCDAHRAYKITVDGAAAADITLTDADGVATTQTLNTASIASAHAINNNSTLAAYVKAFAISTTEIMVISRSNGGLFTAADGGGTGTLTVDNRYIMLLAKEYDVQFDVELDPSFGTLSGFHMYTIGSTGDAGTTTIAVTTDGVVTTTAGANDSSTQATYAAALNTALTNASITNVYASYDVDETEAVVWSSSANERVAFTFSATSTSVLVDDYTYFAKYPGLSGADVFRMFHNQKDQGPLSNLVYMDQPDPEANYVLYVLEFSGDKISALHGASYDAAHTSEVHLYVKESAIDDDIYQSDLPDNQYNMVDVTVTGKTLDTNLEELLAVWAGTAPSTW